MYQWGDFRKHWYLIPATAAILAATLALVLKQYRAAVGGAGAGDFGSQPRFAFAGARRRTKYSVIWSNTPITSRTAFINDWCANATCLGCSALLRARRIAFLKSAILLRVLLAPAGARNLAHIPFCACCA